MTVEIVYRDSPIQSVKAKPSGSACEITALKDSIGRIQFAHKNSRKMECNVILNSYDATKFCEAVLKMIGKKSTYRIPHPTQHHPLIIHNGAIEVGVHICETRNNKLPCVYDVADDPYFDECLFCQQPRERR